MSHYQVYKMPESLQKEFRKCFETGRLKGILEERNRWTLALEQVLSHYPKDVFLPGGRTEDARSADLIRFTCQRIEQEYLQITIHGE